MLTSAQSALWLCRICRMHATSRPSPTSVACTASAGRPRRRSRRTM